MLEASCSASIAGTDNPPLVLAYPLPTLPSPACLSSVLFPMVACLLTCVNNNLKRPYGTQT